MTSTYGVDLSHGAEEIGTDAGKIQRNAFLHEIYLNVYGRILREVPAREFPRMLEIGSGGGFFSELAPHAITSDCVAAPGIARVVNACQLGAAFAANELDAITMFNVFHHLPNASDFLRGAAEVLRPGGRIVMVEPWFTPLGQWFYRLLHHEPYLSAPENWSIVGDGRLAGANSRLPTSVFRDSDARFAREFPAFAIIRREPFHKWLYLFSGGLKLNTRVPRALARAAVRLDDVLTRGDSTLGLFALIVVEKRARQASS